jgi:hypothetical protein
MTGTTLAKPARNVSRARRATAVTMLVALAVVITTVLALRGPGTRSASSHATDTTGAFENGWSTRTGGNLTSASWRTQVGHVGDTTGAYENGWSTRTGGNRKSRMP